MDKNLLDSLDFGEMVDTDLKSNITETVKEDIEGQSSLNIEDENKPKDGLKPDDFGKSVETFSPDELLESSDVKDSQGNDKEDADSGKDKIKTPPQTSSKSSSSSFPHALVFKQLSEEGVLDEFNEEEFNKTVEEKGATEAILDLYRKQSQKVVDETINDLEDDVKLYLELRESGVDPNKASSLASNIKGYSSIKDEDLEGDEALDKRKSILNDYYKASTKLSQEEIDELIEDKIAAGKDEKEAKKGKEYLIKYNEEQARLAKKEESDREHARQNSIKERTEKLNKYISERDEFLKDVKVNKQTKQKMIDAITKPYQVVNGNPVSLVEYYRLTKPEEFASMVAYIAVTGGFDGKWAKPIQAAKTETMKDLTNAIETSNNSYKSGKPNMNIDDEKNAGDEFDLAMSMLNRAKRK